MKNQIMDCLSNPSKADRIDRVLDSFTLKPLNQSGLTTADMELLLGSAKSCLKQYTYRVPDVQYKSHLAIRKLGRAKRKKNETGPDQTIYKTAKHMARILSAYGEDITLSVISKSNGMGQMDSQFVISSEAPSREPLVSMIRSAYGKVETAVLKELPDFGIRMYATGSPVFRDKDASKRDREKEFHKYESWITAVLGSLPADGNYTVKLRFSPVQDTNGMERQLEQLNEYYRLLRFYGDMNWSNNVNLGLSINEGQNFVEGFVGTNSNGYNSGYSMNLGSQDIHKEAMLLTDQIEHEIMRLNYCLNSSSWAVSICVSAEDMDTIQTLTSVVSGTLSEAGVQLRWGGNSAAAPMVVNAEEVLPLMLFPTKEFCGFSFAENEEFSLVSQSDSQEGFQVGNILWNGTPFSTFCLSPKALSRHAFICGMTGAGKTNTLFKIMEGVDLPFCVIEPVKGEYRALKGTYPDLKVWTMKATDDSDPAVQIMRINPFWFPRRGNLAFHIDSLKTIIASSFELTAAMPNILEQCLYNIYVKAGWDLVTNRNIYWDKVPEEYLYPTFSDLCSEIEDYLNNSDFSGDLMGDYKGALLSRMKSFVNGYKGILLNTSAHPDYEQIMLGHSVLELEGLADDADKCLVMGTILIQYYQYLKLNFKDSPAERKLQHLLVIEEAHRLFKNTKTGKRSDGGPNPTGQLVDSLSNMMAEIRAFGEGMLIVDQSPTKIAEDVIKNSATKIVHRIDNSNDIKAMQSAMLLPDDLLSFASLAQGEALVRTDGMEKPCKVKMYCSSVKEEYSLASSFQTADITGNPLADVFIANSVLTDEMTCELVQEKVATFLDCLTLFGMDSWYALVGDMLCDILGVLRERKAIDAVDYKLSVLFEIISLALKRMYSTQSMKDLGMVHMLVMRLLDFFRDQRDGRFIKPGAIDLFRQYMNMNVESVVKSVHLEHTGLREHMQLCDAAELDPDDLFSMMVTSYIHDILPAVEHDCTVPDADELMCSFLVNCVSFTVQAGVVEHFYPAFEKLSAYLAEMVK